MKVLLSGATGFIGRYLLDELLKNDHKIYAIVRKFNSSLDSRVEQINLTSLNTLDETFDVFINLAGENIASKPWSEKRKTALYESRIGLTDQIRRNLMKPPKRVISMSAVGYYGVAREGVFNENTLPKDGFAHELCDAWEKTAMLFPAPQAVVIFRLGVVLGVGGALDKMRLPFKLGLGGPLADGKQWFSWIHINDVINAILSAMSDKSYEGVYNLVAPEFIDQKTFAKHYAKSLSRSVILPTPKWLLNLIFGEMATLLTEGPKIIPSRLQEKNFEFKYKDLKAALFDIEEKYQLR